MKAWRVDEIADPARVHLADVPVPAAEGGQYLIKVEASGLNFLDTLVVKGQYQTKPALPFTPGMEVVGTVVQDGSPGNVDSLPVGTRVASSCSFGGYAEYAVAHKGHVIAISATMPAGAALALRGNYPTSLYALRQASHLAPGETLLVHAGAGGVGSAAVQLGKMIGARVIATAGGPDKLAACREAGADEVVDYNDAGWLDQVRRLAPKGVDVVYDPVGGDIGTQSMRCLAFGARYLVIGFAGGTLTALPANRLLLHNASAIGVLWGEIRKREPALARQLTREVYDAYDAGRLKPLAAATFPFSHALQAMHALETRQTAGKAVLLMEP